nr:S8 family serine peptidase [Oscillochloris trichoides]
MLHRRSHVLVSAISVLIFLSLFIIPTLPSSAQGGDRPLPSDVQSLRLDQPVSAARKLNPRFDLNAGRTEVVVQLSRVPAALMGNQSHQVAAVNTEQEALLAQINQIDPTARLLGRTQILLNALIVEMDASRLPFLAQDGRVVTINPVVNFQREQGENLPLIGATPPVQQAAAGGAGVRVAVLDSGIDYTHAALGGPGTLAAYQQAYGTGPDDPRHTSLDDLFPTAKVVGGYDFVGETWPNGPLAPDPDPIDIDGHGTHVADIIAGANGVAPAADLYAVKVCSTVSRSCSGAAILLGMEYAVDPNGDGQTDDHVDIVNMSFGSAYGEGYFDELATAVEHADLIGVLTVASAGNNGDRPYIISSPAAAPSALAVAQTHAPSARAFPLEITSPPALAGLYANTATLDWAPITTDVRGTVVSAGRACDPAILPTNLAGQIALVERGDCTVSAKVAHVSAAGAIGVLVALSGPGDALSFTNTGECPSPANGTCAPALVITWNDANRIRSALGSTGVSVSLAQRNTIPLVGSVVGSSSRGPSSGEAFPWNPFNYQYGQLVKPEIAAPGNTISAVAGSGSATAPFGGTSSAAPLVSGAAALLIANSSEITPPFEIKARLMNSAETAISLNPATAPGVLAPITRIGNGELRIDRALASDTAAWEFLGSAAALSFGTLDVSQEQMIIYRVIEVKNYTDQPITYQIDSTFRYADDAENGAVQVRPLRRRIEVPAYLSRYFRVELQIDATKLRPWTLNSGAGGGISTSLNQLEYDGYLTFTDAQNPAHNLHMAWHVLPRLSPDLHASTSPAEGNTTPFTLKNFGVGSATYQAFSLLGENPVAPESGEPGSQDLNITARYLGAASYPAVGICSSSLLLQFGVQTWQPITHANYPVEINLQLDTNRDGQPDAVIYTSEFDGASNFAADGRNATYAGPISGPYTSTFFTQHGTNSGTFILTVCGEQVGLRSTDAGRMIDVVATTRDNYYFTHQPSATIRATMGLLNERYSVGTEPATPPLTQISLGAKTTASYLIRDHGDKGSSEQGILLLNPNGGGREALVVLPR